MENNKGITQGGKLQRNIGRTFLSGLVLVAISAATSHATVLLDDTFTDGSRSDQNLTSSAAWYSSGNASTLTVVSNALFSNTGTTSRQALAYFTNSGSPQTLNVGDSLSVSFSLSETAFSSTSVFRMGLFNSGGTRVSADSTGNTNAAFTNYTGYDFFSSLTSNQGTGTTLRVRSGTDVSLFNTNTAVNVPLSGNAPTLNLTDSSTYNFTLTLTYTSSTAMTVSALVKDSTNTTTLLSFSSTDSTSLFTNFDTFAFYSANGSTAGAGVTLDNVLVNYVAAVPEPSALGLTALGGGFVLWRSRRRMRAA